MKKFNDSVRDYRRYLCSDPLPVDSAQVQSELDDYLEITRLQQQQQQQQANNSRQNNAYKPQFGATGNSYFPNSSSSAKPTHPGTGSKTSGTSSGPDTYRRFTSQFFEDDDEYFQAMGGGKVCTFDCHVIVDLSCLFIECTWQQRQDAESHRWLFGAV
jgi:hypothetical protein